MEKKLGLTVNAYDSVNLDTQIFYSLTDDAGGRFQINSETQIVTIKNNNLLSFKNASSHEIIVEAVSEIGHLKTQTFTIKISDHFGEGDTESLYYEVDDTTYQNLIYDIPLEFKLEDAVSTYPEIEISKPQGFPNTSLIIL